MAKYFHIFLLALCSFPAFAQKNTNALEFVENKGQWDKRVTFMGELGNGAFFLRNAGFTILQHNADDLQALSDLAHGHAHQDNTRTSRRQGADGMSGGNTALKTGGKAKDFVLRSHSYNVEFEGANPNPIMEGDRPQPGYNNYFIGNDKSSWAGGCRIYGAVIYKDIYPNIDIRYFTDEGWVKYEFIVRPGGNPNDIIMRYEGADRVSLSKGELVIKTSVGNIQELPPYTYQQSNKGRQEVEAKYIVKGNRVGFSIANYDPTETLVIDPTLIFCSFTGSKSDNWGFTATYGGDGSLYSGGIVFGNRFPVSPGAYQTTYRASGSSRPQPFNMGIMRFSPNGTQRMYATYIGGNNSDQPHSLIENSRGNLIIAGRTSSTNYPTTQKFGSKSGGWDIVLTELNSTGTGLVGSIVISGEDDDGLNTADSHTGGTQGLINFYGDDTRSEVVLDANDNVYLTACTQSDSFYVTPNAPFKTMQGGLQDGVLIKTNPTLSNVLMSTYFGGKGRDAGFVLDVNKFTGEIWVCGSTESTDFPGIAAGTIGSTYQGGSTDGFIAIFSNDGTVLKKSTYIGTDARDAIYGFEFDRFGDPYLMGVTYGDWKRVNAVYGVNGARQFVGKIKRDLSGWQYTTTFGTNSKKPNISPVAFLVDRCQNIYISGWGGTNLGEFDMMGTGGMEVTPDALKKTTDNNDFYFIVIKKDASALLYATFFGQTGNLTEHVDGGTSRYDQNGVIYQAMCANCYGGTNPRPRFPITPGAWCCSSGYSGADGTGNGAECNLAALKIAFNFAGVGAGASAYINGVRDTVGCVPLTVKFVDTIQNARSYIWNFGDNTPDLATTDFEVNHTFNKVGLFRVRLIAIDSTTCNISDTAYINIKVGADEAKLDFDAVKLPPCQSLSYRFDNLSIPPATKPFSDTSFIWDFGDGTRVVGGVGSINHSFQSPGTYNIRLILRDTIYCNTGDSIAKKFYLSPLVKAQFVLPNGCAPYTVQISNTTLGGQTYAWDFGDGTTSTEREPVKTFAVSGTYRVKLVVTDNNTCNIIDSTFRDIVVQDKPTAGFTYDPVTPVQNTPTTFTNTSSPDAVRFSWNFGDGTILDTTTRFPISYQFNRTATYTVCLAAINASGCADTVCQPVDAIVIPRVDLPNAFTPLGPAPNNQVFVRGFGIARMRLLIFNRFGQKVFESNSTKIGWDGKFNGVVQPMDAYAYVLDVDFTDGTKTTRKGDITLIR